MTQTARLSSARFGVLVLGILVAVMTPAIVLAAGGRVGTGFDAVVDGIESRYHARATRIPFIGLAGIVAGIATHGGVRGLHVAQIEQFDGSVDGTELDALIEQRAGAGWQRIVRDTETSGGEQTLIYARPDGERLAMLVVNLEGREMNVVQVSVNPDMLSDEIAKRRHGHDRGEDGAKNDVRQSGGSE